MKQKSIYEQKEFHTEQLVNTEYERIWRKYHFLIKHHYSCFTDRNPEADRITVPDFLIKWLCMHQVSDNMESESAAALVSSLHDHLLHIFFFLQLVQNGEREADHIQAPVYNKRQRFIMHYESILSLHNGELLFYYKHL